MLETLNILKWIKIIKFFKNNLVNKKFNNTTNKVRVDAISLYNISFIHKYELTYNKLTNLKNSTIVFLKKSIVINFMNNLQQLLKDTLKSNKNFYIFSNYKSFNMHWDINLTTQFFRSTSVNNFKKILCYYFYRNNIKLLITLNFTNFKFLNLISKLNLTKVGFLSNLNTSNYFHYYLYLPYINLNIQTYLYNFTLSVYIKYINTKYKNYRNYYYFKLNKYIIK